MSCECKFRENPSGKLLKSPVVECNDVMQQFDKILEEYNKILTPFSYCGSFEQTANNCESLQPKVDLPPIHWDCPDPLPKTACTNLDCPFLIPEKRLSVPEFFCNDPNCPFPIEEEASDLQDTCSNSDCPFNNLVKNEELVVPQNSLSICDNPQCPERIEKVPTKKQKKKLKRKRKGKYVLSGKQKPLHLDNFHKECLLDQDVVPGNMGWLWNVEAPQGWRPGAINKQVASRIKTYHQSKGLHSLKLNFKDMEEPVKPKTTLQIQRKNGVFLISLNPLKNPKDLADREDPYMNCSPIQFKIQKPKQEAEDSQEECACSSDSDLDIEFTPPAGVIEPEKFKRKANLVHCDSQCCDEDFELLKQKEAKKMDDKSGKKKKLEPASSKKKEAPGKEDKVGGKKKEAPGKEVKAGGKKKEAPGKEGKAASKKVVAKEDKTENKKKKVETTKAVENKTKMK